MSDIAYLDSIEVFAGLSEREKEDVSRHVLPVHLEKGAYLFYRNDQSTGLYMVAKGSIQIIIDNETNKEIVVYTISAGDIVGEMTLFNEAERTATAVALEECRLLKIKNSKFIDLLKLYPTIAINMTKILIDRLHAANAMIERLGMMDGSERVIHFLKSLIMREGGLRDEFYFLPHKPTYRQISQRLGVSEKTVYRTMQARLKSGEIKTQGRQLYIQRSLIDNLE